jgi:DNA-nicking Smr family endonuclease
MKKKVPSKQRLFSEEDEAFFRAHLKDARPLAKFRARVSAVRTDAESVAAAFQSAHHARVLRVAPTPGQREGPAPAIGGHSEMHVRRGRLEPDARLDLHGYHQAGAYRAVLAFLSRGQAEDWRLLLIITGKGGVLREELPYWLGQSALKPLITGIAPSHIRHGGSGAFYVFLRRTRGLAREER